MIRNGLFEIFRSTCRAFCQQHLQQVSLKAQIYVKGVKKPNKVKEMKQVDIKARRVIVFTLKLLPRNLGGTQK